MMCMNKYKKLCLKIPSDLSSTGKEEWKWKPIDACIYNVVKALSQSGIDMKGSCCGHGKVDGEILLVDGRKIIIKGDTK